jgi:cation transport regulator ChaB
MKKWRIKMPYGNKSELPDAVKKDLTAHGQTIWKSAFNNAFKEYKGNEKKAFGTAWKAAMDYHKSPKS